ncbi:MAG: GGDEF domain-containing protein [Treponema sp.]|nr:GGDEF domain-containing protein [Treponema sp.]
MIFTYFEVITYSLISELITGGAFFYIFYVIGMLSSVFYLLPPKRQLKQILQGIGILYAITIYFVHIKEICLFPQYLPIVDYCKQEVGFFNLCTTLITLFYISNLYFFEMYAANEKLTYFSNHDLLTGLYNRRYFEHKVEKIKAKNESEGGYAIAMFDIDDFKKVNDTYGHQAGDLVLRIVSAIIDNPGKKEYLAVRWGGEEFILYMPKTDEATAYEQLLSICKKIEATEIDYDGKRIAVTATIGMAMGTNINEYESVISQADDRLYYGKRNGKNQVVK